MTLVLEVDDVLNDFYEARLSQNASQGIDESKKSELTLPDLERDLDLTVGPSLAAKSNIAQVPAGDIGFGDSEVAKRGRSAANAHEPNEAGEVRFFEPSAGFGFRRRDIRAGQVREKSVIGDLVGPIALLSIQVTFKVTSQDTFRVEIPKNGNFAALIAATVKRHNADLVKKGLPQLDENAELYIVNTLGEDGKVKSGESGDIEHKKLLFRFATQHFLVQPNPGHLNKPSEVLLKINLPAGQKHTVTVAPTLKVIALLPEVCEKRKMEPADYTLLYKYGNVPKDLTAAEVAAEDALLHIVAKDALRKDDDDQSEIFWYRKLAEKYKRYNVLFVQAKRKKGKLESKEESILGIDGEHVSHTVIKKKGNKQFPPVPLRGVKACQLLASEDGSSSKRFAIEFTDGTSKTFDAGSNQLAREIVGKIQFLLQ